VVKHAIAPIRLGAIKGGIGPREQRRTRVAACRFGQSHTHGYCQFGRDESSHTVSEDARARHSRLRQNDDKLVTTITRDEIRLAQRLSDQLRDVFQDFAAEKTPIFAIELLEFIDLEYSKGKTAVAPCENGKKEVELFVECSSIANAGDRIGPSLRKCGETRRLLPDFLVRVGYLRRELQGGRKDLLGRIANLIPRFPAVVAP